MKNSDTEWTEERRRALLAIMLGEEHIGLFMTSLAFRRGVLYLAGEMAGRIECLAEGILELEAQAMIDHG